MNIPRLHTKKGYKLMPHIHAFELVTHILTYTTNITYFLAEMVPYIFIDKLINCL